LITITDPLRHHVQAQFISKKLPFQKIVQPSIDDSTITEMLMKEFEDKWNNLEKRISMVPGKKVFAKLNTYLQEKYQITITLSQLIDCFNVNEVPADLFELIENLDNFRSEAIGEGQQLVQD